MKRLLLSGLLCVAACSTPPTQQQVTAGVQGAVYALVCYKEASGTVKAAPLGSDWADKADAAATVALTEPACQAALAVAVSAAPAK